METYDEIYVWTTCSLLRHTQCIILNIYIFGLLFFKLVDSDEISSNIGIIIIQWLLGPNACHPAILVPVQKTNVKFTSNGKAVNVYTLGIGAVISLGVRELHLSCSQQSPFAANARRFPRPSWRNASHCWK